MPDKKPIKLTEKQVNKYIEGIYDGSITEYDLSTEVYDSIVSYLKSGLYKGFGQTLEEAEGADLELLSQLRENVYMFGAAKSYQMTKEISSLLVGDDGEVRTAKEFNDIARETYENWNDNWGETEYQTAIGQAKSASKWNEIEKQKDTLPNLRYSAIMDENTSDICAPLNGLIAPVDDPIWDTCAPLNHFNCFVPETPVLTSGGWVGISDIREGDLVIGGSGKEQKVIAVHIKGFKGKMINIRIKYYSVTATKEHRFLTTKGWRMAENIRPGDVLIQDIEIGLVNKFICAINNFYVVTAHLYMSIVRKRKPSIMNAFDANAESRDEDVNKSIVNQFVNNAIQPAPGKIIKNLLFSCGGFLVKNAMSFWIGIVGVYRFLVGLSADIWLEHGIVGSHPGRRVRSFLADGPMGKLFSRFRHFFAGCRFSILGIYPLGLYRLPALAGLEFKHPEQPDHRSHADIPFRADHSKGLHFDKVNPVEGFAAGQPLDRFNSLFNFFIHSFFNRSFRLVSSCHDEYFEGQIYNLSVGNDETYITNVGVVHNCRCVLLQEDGDATLTPDDDKDDAQDKVEDEMSDVFKSNPGKDGEIFNKDHPYFEVAKEDRAYAKRNFDLPIPPTDEDE